MVSVVIIDYNSMKQTISYINNFIEKLINITGVNFIIVDNSTNEDNFIELSDFFKVNNILSESLSKEIYRDERIDKFEKFEIKNCKIVAIKCKENYGYAKGNNIGASISKNIFNDSYIIFSNNDISLEKDINMQSFIDVFKINPNIAVVGPKIFGIDGKPQNPKRKVNIWKLLVLGNLNMLTMKFFDEFIEEIDYTNESKYAYWVSGCFMLVDSKKFFEVGMFDDYTFLYGEEMILTERLLKKGYLNYYYNDFEIIHYHGKTIKKSYDVIQSCEISFNSVYYYYKNYIKSSKFELYMARISFLIMKTFFPIKAEIKRIINKK